MTNLAELFDPAFEKAGDRPAMILAGAAPDGAGDDIVTYDDLGAATASAANALATMGVGSGDRVALVDECTSLFVATVLGAARIGAAAAPMSHRLAPGEIRELHGVAECDRAVAGTGCTELLSDALGRSPQTQSVILGWGGDMPPASAVGDGDDAVIIFTSGTTGRPKPVPLSHADLGLRVQLFSEPFDPDRTPVTSLICVPVVHVGGLIGLMVALAAGTTNVVQRRFDAGEWLALVERHEVQRTFLVPAMLHRILDHPDLRARDLSSLRSIAYGAAPASTDLVHRAVEALPDVEFSNVFGQTETIGAVSALTADDHRDPSRIGSVGKPLPGLEWRIVEPGTETEVRAGDLGEFQVEQGGAWHATGDLVRVDADGYLWAEGRLSDTINRGGEKLGPVEVEAVLREHPAVNDCAVAGLPDEELGERIGAAVVLREPVPSDELIDWCRERLAPWKVPERLTPVDEIPLTELGKISRPTIARLIEEAGDPSR